MLDKWIVKAAKKDFSETINWIEAFTVFFIGLLLATAIFLDVTPITLTIPAKSLDAHRIIISQDYRESLPKTRTLSLQYKDKNQDVHILSRNYALDRNFILTLQEDIPAQTNLRIVIGERSILDMLLKSKSIYSL